MFAESKAPSFVVPQTGKSTCGRRVCPPSPTNGSGHQISGPISIYVKKRRKTPKSSNCPCFHAGSWKSRGISQIWPEWHPCHPRKGCIWHHKRGRQGLGTVAAGCGGIVDAAPNGFGEPSWGLLRCFRAVWRPCRNVASPDSGDSTDSAAESLDRRFSYRNVCPKSRPFRP